MTRMPTSEVANRVARHALWVSSSGHEGERLILPQADLRGVDLAGADLSEAVFVDANLSGARLARTNLYGANLTAADLSDADLSQASLVKADADRITGQRMLLRGANLMRASFNDADLRNVVFDGARLLKTGFGGDLRGCSFRECYFERTRFSDVVLGESAAEGATGGAYCFDSVFIENLNGERHLASDAVLEEWLAASGGVVTVKPPATR